MDDVMVYDLNVFYPTIIALIKITMSFILSKTSRKTFSKQSERILNVACSVLIGMMIILMRLQVMNSTIIMNALRSY